MATLAEIAAYRPKDIDEALDGMHSALYYFHRENDDNTFSAITLERKEEALPKKKPEQVISPF